VEGLVASTESAFRGFVGEVGAATSPDQIRRIGRMPRTSQRREVGDVTRTAGTPLRVLRELGAAPAFRVRL